MAHSATGTRNRILVPLLYSYYLFDYMKHLVPRLIRDGFEVTIVTFDPKVEAQYRALDPAPRVERGPAVLRALNNRSGKIPFRIALWAYAWIWGWLLRRRFDAVIVPFDQRPIWYVLCRSMFSMTCHTTTEQIDLDLAAVCHRMTRKGDIGLGLSIWLDRVTGGRILPRILGHVTVYVPKLMLVDRLMGFRAPSTFLGVSGCDIVVLTGEQGERNMLRLDSPLNRNHTRYVVTGSPAYEKVFEIAEDFGPEDRSRMRDELGLPGDRPVYTLFLSPSHFSEEQVEEIAEVCAVIRNRPHRPFLVIKYHPKTRIGDPERIRTRLNLGDGDLLTITAFGGDEFNTRLILLSHCLVQKQSTVGYIAMLLGVPIVSYNLRNTDYSDDMYKILGASFHAESADELAAAFARLETDEGRAALAKMQETACRNHCLREPSPCARISTALREGLEGKFGAGCVPVPTDEKS